MATYNFGSVDIQNKFRKILSIGYLGMAEDGKSLKFRQTKGNNYAIPNAIL